MEGDHAQAALALPTPTRAFAALRKETDEAFCLETPIGFGAIGFYYRDFHQMSDDEVTDLLARAPAPLHVNHDRGLNS
jgi:putative phosphoribosyl transferase